MSAYRSNVWILFLSVLFFLIGIYCGARIGINFALFPKYPVSGVIPLLQTSYLPPVSSESSCYQGQTYYTSEGMPTTTPTQAEKMQASNNLQSCLQNVFDTRAAVLLNDIGTATFFLFLGVGLLIVRRILK